MAIAPGLIAEAATAGRVSVRHGVGGQNTWQLQADQVSLPEILHSLEMKSGMVIHHSLREGKRVSATCVADALPGILKCLLGESVNLVFGPKQGAIPSEVWILGSTAATGANVECLTPVAVSEDKPDPKMEIQNLREQVGSNDPRQRGDALYALASTEADDVDAALRNGFTDDSALVREQAFGGWVRRHGAESAAAELYQAMSDAEASVRLRAVELTAEPMLLRQASEDSDATVRQLARARLAELAH